MRKAAIKALPFEPDDYLHLLKLCLTRAIFEDETYVIAPTPQTFGNTIIRYMRQFLEQRGYSVMKREPFKFELREEGKDWPLHAETMVGLKRLDNIQACVQDVLKHNVPGDFIETGVWRGGSVILMRAILKRFNVTNRNVWVADSFEGLPKPDAEKYEKDAGDQHWQMEPLAISMEQVKKNFERYNLLDDQVKFLKGWFKDTLPTAPIKKLAVLRLDGDMYESTMDAFNALYDKVSVGGYIIVDDYYALPNCAAATEDFRAARGISTPIHRIDWTGVYWKKEK